MIRAPLAVLGLVLISSTSLSQRHFEKQDSVCPVPQDHKAAVERDIDEASLIKSALSKDRGQQFTRSHFLGSLATAEVCLGRYEQAAQDADAAYPAGSDALAELGKMLVRSGRVLDTVPFGQRLHHGNHSLLFGVSDELAEEGKFIEAQKYAEQIDSPEVRFSAQQKIAFMYQAGHTQEGDAFLEKLNAGLPERQRREMPSDQARLGPMLEAHQWKDARTLAQSLPEKLREMVAIEIATGETDDHNAEAKSDLSSALKGYNESAVGSPFGYQLSSRLASLRDYEDAERAAEAVHDDEWNQRAWTTIAIFRAEDSSYDQARSALARIGKGSGLIHPLNMDALGRDTARVRIASVLLARGRPEAALTFLNEIEDQDGGSGNDLVTVKIEALVRVGQIPKALAVVDGLLADHKGYLSEEDYSAADALVRAWSSSDSSAATAWVRKQSSAEIQFSCWLALANEASGAKPPIYRYFVNWD